MRTAVRIAAAVLALGAAACGNTPGQQFTAKDQASIRSNNDALVQAINAKDVGKIVGFYAENSTFMPPNRPIIRGKDSLKSYYQDFVKDTSAVHLTVDEVSGSGPLAYQTGTYEMDTKNGKGQPYHDRGKYLFILRSLGGNWRYEYSMWNSDLPSADQPGN
jgi:ketosteroid isomerase-like protein